MYTRNEQIRAFIQKNQNSMLLLFSLLLVALPLLINAIARKPLFTSPQTYSLFAQASEPAISPFLHILQLVQTNVIVQICYIALLVIIAAVLISKSDSEKKLAWIFFLASPLALEAFASINAYAFSLTCSFLTYVLCSSQSKWRYLAPFSAILAIVDVFSAVLLALVLFVKLRERTMARATIALIVGFTAISFSSLALALGPFGPELKIANILADVGSNTGVSIFVILLAFIGYKAVSEKAKIEITTLLLITISSYLLNTTTALYLALLLSYLAAKGFYYLKEQEWESRQIKHIAFLLIFLGVLFSTLSYYSNISETGPFDSDKKALEWIKENTPQNAKVISDPLNNGMIKHIAKREPVGSFEQRTQERAREVLEASYIKDIENTLAQGRYVLFISKEMNEKMSKQEGISLLLESERFKLSFSHSESEVYIVELGE